MLFVIHATDRRDGMATRAKFYRAHRIHLDEADKHNVDVVTAGTLLAADGETPVGSVFVIDAKDRAATEAFARRPLPGQWRLGDGSNPRLQQEARHSHPVATKSLIAFKHFIIRGSGSPLPLHDIGIPVAMSYFRPQQAP